MRGSIEQISAYVPPKVRKTTDHTGFSNRERLMFQKVVGIEEIHICETSNINMALAACDPLDVSAVDFIVYVTQTPDVPIPGMSHRLQHALNLTCGCLDINSACNGFIQGLMVSYLLAEQGKTVLLVFSEYLTKIQEPGNTNVLMFGDAAVAMVITATYFSGNFSLYSDGSRFESVWQPDKYLLMDGETVLDFAMTDVLSILQEEDYNYIDKVVLHQSNLYILKQVQKKLGLLDDDMLINIQRFGNTSAVSIPLALVTEKPRGIVLACGYGAGLNYGKATFDYYPEKVYYNGE